MNSKLASIAIGRRAIALALFSGQELEEAALAAAKEYTDGIDQLSAEEKAMRSGALQENAI